MASRRRPAGRGAALLAAVAAGLAALAAVAAGVVAPAPAPASAAAAAAAGAAAPGRAAAATTRSAVDTTAYEGLGAWLDVFDTDLRRNASATVARLSAQGVTTVYLQTSNWSRTYDVQAPDLTGAVLDAAQAAGMKVVAWYLPGLQSPAVDLRRSRAAIAFRSASGAAFDGFALDIEDTSVRDAALRTKRLLALLRGIRATAPRPYPIGAIVPPPVAMLFNPAYWPGFPWAQIAAASDAFVPMAYSSYRRFGAGGVFQYTVANVALLRALVGDPGLPVHVVGGVASGMKAPDVEGFVEAAVQQGAAGGSLYDVATTRAAHWPLLAPLTALRSS